MFETVAPETFRPPNRRLYYETLPISIAVHLVGIGAAFASMIWNVVLPTQSPRMIVAYSLTQLPDPPPPPPPPPKVVLPKVVPAVVKVAPPPQSAPTQIVAPTVIPDTIPDLVPPPTIPPPPAPVPAAAAPAVADAGSPGGMTGGLAGGTGHALGVAGGITFGNDGRVYVDRTVKLPLKEVDHEYPHYPDAARKNHLEGSCVVRYTVGKNGRIIDIAILNHAADPMFDEETLNTIRGWRYRPMTVNGKPVEVVHEVEVNYQYIVR